MKVHLVGLVLDGTQRGLLRGGRGVAEDGEGLVGVAGEDDVFEQLRRRFVAPGSLMGHLDAARHALHGDDRG